MSYSNDKVSDSFRIQEFVPPDIYHRFGPLKSRWFIDMRIVLINQWIHDYTGKPTWINDWLWNNEPTKKIYSGYRPPDCPEGAFLSQHKFKCASDTKVRGIVAEELREILRKNFDLLNINYGLTTIEKKTPTWTHLSLQWQPTPKLYEINP